MIQLAKGQFGSVPRKYKVVFLGLFFIAFYTLFSNLGKAPLENWDEAWYAQMTREMLRTKDFITIHWNYELSLDKMPLPIWLNSFFASIFGLNEFSLRLTSAISGLAVISLATYYSYKKYGFIPSLFAFSTLLFNALFIFRARSANIDTLTALLVLLFFFVLISKNNTRFLFAGALLSAIYLTRGSFVLYPALIFVLHEFLYRRKLMIKNLKSYALMLCAAIIPSALWLSAGFLKAGVDFLNFYLFNSDHDVAKITLSSFNSNYILHTYYALQRRFFFIFILAILLLLTKIRNNENFLIIAFGSLLIIFLSFAQKDNNWYLVPSMAFWSIAIAFFVKELLNLLKLFPKIQFPAKALLVAGLIFLSARSYTVNIVPIINSTGAVGQKNAGLYIQNYTLPSETLVRLDHLYPSLIYYADRKVISSPYGSGSNDSGFIGRAELIQAIKQGRIKWLSGTNEGIESFTKELEGFHYERKDIGHNEMLLKIK